MTCDDLVRVNAPLPSEQESRAVLNERTRLALSLRMLAAKTFGEAGRLSDGVPNAQAIREGVFGAAVMRRVANLIERGEL